MVVTHRIHAGPAPISARGHVAAVTAGLGSPPQACGRGQRSGTYLAREV